jgi:hypothetical protein
MNFPWKSEHEVGVGYDSNQEMANLVVNVALNIRTNCKSFLPSEIFLVLVWQYKKWGLHGKIWQYRL